LIFLGFLDLTPFIHLFIFQAVNGDPVMQENTFNEPTSLPRYQHTFLSSLQLFFTLERVVFRQYHRIVHSILYIQLFSWRHI
jgi:hypothetical protein